MQVRRLSKILNVARQDQIWRADDSSLVHSVYTFSFVSEISTCSVVSLVHPCYLRKFYFFTLYLRKFHVSYFISESCVLQIIPAGPIVFLNHVFTHTGTQLYLLTMSFSRSQQTNRHLGARQTQIEEATKFNKHKAIQQNT